jgi:carbamoyl-phosphate synthase large subunit
MDDITALVTGAGAPGIIGTIYSLRNNYDGRKIKLVGTDIKDGVIGKYFMDSFHVVPKPYERNFTETFLAICESEDVDAILPQVTNELEVFSKNVSKFEKIDVRVGVSNQEGLHIANNKFLLTKLAERIGCRIPKIELVKSLTEFGDVLPSFGYPKKPVAVKPPVSRGMRGLRIIDEKKDKFDLWANEKPTGVYLTKKDFEDIFDGKNFPELMVMEYLQGEEYTVDALAMNGEPFVTIPRKRLLIRSGITFQGIIEAHEPIIKYSNALIKELELSYAFGFQFKLDENDEPKLLECNPRIQGTMVMATFAGANILYSALKLLLGEEIPNFKVRWGTKFIRYWGGISVVNDKMMEKL